MGATKYGFPCIGAIYEPEYTSPTEIATDIRMMKETGIGLVFTGSRLLSDAISDGETRLSALCDLLGRLRSADILAVIRLPFEDRPSETGETVVGKKPLFLPKVVIDGVSAENYLPSAEKIIKALSRYSNVVGWQICPDGSLPCDEKIIFDYIRGLSPLPVCIGEDGGCGIFRIDEGRRDTISLFSKEPCVENVFSVSDYARTARGEFFFQQAMNSLGGFVPKGMNYVATLLPIFMGGSISLVGHWKGRDPSCLVSPYNRPTYLENDVRRAANAISAAKEFLSLTRAISNVAVLRRDPYFDLQTNAFVKALHRNGCCPDVISKLSFDRYSIIFTPYCPSLGEEADVVKLSKWVENGGVWVVGPQSDTLDGQGEYPKRSPFAHIEKYTSAFLRYDIADPDGKIKAYSSDGVLFAKGGRCMLFDPDGNDLVLVSDSDPAVDGKSCAKCVPYGKGHIVILGMTPTEEGLDQIIKGAFYLLKAAPAVTLGKVAVTERLGSEFNGSPIEGVTVCEYGGGVGLYHCPRPALDLISGKMVIGNIDLTPYQALVLKFVE